MLHPVYAQKQHNFETLTKATGLPFRHITSIAQDSLGFIWLGSLQGLFRYDGNEFKSFNRGNTSTNYIPKDRISYLTVDRSNKNYLWFVADGNLFKMNLSMEELATYSEAANIRENILDLKAY